jgi:hypothetical protein
MSTTDNNIFARDGFFWWMGVVENRQDPLKLGRCQVRILGYHSDDNKKVLPMKELPWAMPLQPVLSAGTSGIGDAPVGPVEGTWVVGFFADGKDCQQPIMMGTFGGIPQSSNAVGAQIAGQDVPGSTGQNAVMDAFGNILKDQNGFPVLVTPQATIPGATASNAISSTLPPLGQTNLQNFMDFIGKQESSSIAGGVQNYGTVNSKGYAGKYQFGAQALQTTGYVIQPPGRVVNNADLNNAANWTGKNGINSLDDWLANKNNAQESAMYALTKSNYDTLVSQGIIDSANSSPQSVAGYLSVAHLLGPGGARALANGSNGADAYGTRASTYYTLGALSQGATTSVATTLPVAQSYGSSRQSSINPVFSILSSVAGLLNNPKMGQPEAFGDPNGVYPEPAYINRADTNLLATNDQSSVTTKTLLKAKEDNRVEKIDVANEASDVWAEPKSPYNAKYPYNHVKETEAGHVVELDDTPNAERLHIWHKSGTYVEIDKNGTVTYRVAGENYEIFARNSNVYVQGNHNVTVDGAKTLLIKHALDVEVLGKTTINIKNDADIDIAGDLNLKAKNINVETLEKFTLKVGSELDLVAGAATNLVTAMDLNIKSGADTNLQVANDFSVKTGTDFNVKSGNYQTFSAGGDVSWTVGGDEQHEISGALDVDASIVNLNSGTANATTPPDVSITTPTITSGLDTLEMASISAAAVDDTKLNVLPTDIANPLNPTAKVLSSFTGDIGGGFIGNNFTAGGLSGIVNNLGLNGLNDVLAQANVGSLENILNKVGFPNVQDIPSLIAQGGFNALDTVLKNANLGGLQQILQGAGLNINSNFGDVFNQNQTGIWDAIKATGIIPVIAIDQGIALINNFVRNGGLPVDRELASAANNVIIDETEFSSWYSFPDSTRISRYFTLGDVSSRVHEPCMQFPIIEQAGLQEWQITANLKAVAVNILDPIFERYPNVQIADAFRPVAAYVNNVNSNNPIADLYRGVKLASSASTQNAIDARLNTPTPYQLGQAVTLHFKGIKATEYFAVAQWIRTHIAFDQMRLEYTTLGNGEPWIYLSFNRTHNRGKDSLDKILTCMNGQPVANYLVNFGEI